MIEFMLVLQVSVTIPLMLLIILCRSISNTLAALPGSSRGVMGRDPAVCLPMALMSEIMKEASQQPQGTSLPLMFLAPCCTA